MSKNVSFYLFLFCCLSCVILVTSGLPPPSSWPSCPSNNLLVKEENDPKWTGLTPPHVGWRVEIRKETTLALQDTISVYAHRTDEELDFNSSPFHVEQQIMCRLSTRRFLADEAGTATHNETHSASPASAISIVVQFHFLHFDMVVGMPHAFNASIRAGVFPERNGDEGENGEHAAAPPRLNDFRLFPLTVQRTASEQGVNQYEFQWTHLYNQGAVSFYDLYLHTFLLTFPWSTTTRSPMLGLGLYAYVRCNGDGKDDLAILKDIVHLERENLLEGSVTNRGEANVFRKCSESVGTLVPFASSSADTASPDSGDVQQVIMYYFPAPKREECTAYDPQLTENEDSDDEYDLGSSNLDDRRDRIPSRPPHPALPMRVVLGFQPQSLSQETQLPYAFEALTCIAVQDSLFANGSGPWAPDDPVLFVQMCVTGIFHRPRMNETHATGLRKCETIALQRRHGKPLRFPVVPPDGDTQHEDRDTTHCRNTFATSVPNPQTPSDDAHLLDSSHLVLFPSRIRYEDFLVLWMDQEGGGASDSDPGGSAGFSSLFSMFELRVHLDDVAWAREPLRPKHFFFFVAKCVVWSTAATPYLRSVMTELWSPSTWHPGHRFGHARGFLRGLHREVFRPQEESTKKWSAAVDTRTPHHSHLSHPGPQPEGLRRMWIICICGGAAFLVAGVVVMAVLWFLIKRIKSRSTQRNFRNFRRRNQEVENEEPESDKILLDWW